MAKRERVSDVLIRELGVKRALYVETFVMLWALFAAAHGRDPETVDELAVEIGKDRSTVFRWQVDFRLAFPDWSTPRDLLDQAHVGKRRAMTLGQVRRLAVS